MARQLRAAGIPARVAFGWTLGNRRKGNTYTLTNKNLHAWTEIYFDGYGWVPFDPTPAGDIAGSASSAWAPEPNRSSGPVVTLLPRSVLARWREGVSARYAATITAVGRRSIPDRRRRPTQAR